MKRRAAYRYRSAVTGRFITAAVATRRPRTTVRERIKPRPRLKD